LPHAEARQNTLHLLATANRDDYQRRYEDCRHAVSYAYEALNDNAAQAKPLPPDPEGMNNGRAEWAAAALRHFQCTTGTDFEDALADLLGDLMHWSDRNGANFDDDLSRARMHYEAETTAEDTTASDATEGAPAARPCQSPVKSEQRNTVTTKTYKAEFFTAADYAFRNFEAETPEQALQLARQFYDEDIGELDFRSYDDNAGVDEIQIWDSQRGTLARWESDDYRLRKSACELLEALKDLHDQLEFFGMDTSKRPSLERSKAAIAKAENRGLQ